MACGRPAAPDQMWRRWPRRASQWPKKPATQAPSWQPARRTIRPPSSRVSAISAARTRTSKPPPSSCVRHAMPPCWSVPTTGGWSGAWWRATCSTRAMRAPLRGGCRPHRRERQTRMEAEFHCGWIALRFLGRPTAARHFANLSAEASVPSRFARGILAGPRRRGDGRPRWCTALLPARGPLPHHLLWPDRPSRIGAVTGPAQPAGVSASARNTFSNLLAAEPSTNSTLWGNVITRGHL